MRRASEQCIHQQLGLNLNPAADLQVSDQLDEQIKGILHTLEKFEAVCSVIDTATCFDDCIPLVKQRCQQLPILAPQALSRAHRFNDTGLFALAYRANVLHTAC